MSEIKVTIEWPVYTEDGGGNEVETVYQIDCSLTPYDPGRISGPPEDCYPPEGGECEILKVSLDGREIKNWEALKLDEDAIAEKALEKAPSREDDDPPDPRDD